MVLVHAPDFPEEVYLEPHEQLTLESAFVELREGLHYAPGLRKNETKLQSTRLQLSQAEEAFARGDFRDAGAILQGVETDLFGGPPLKA